ncbi:4-hydroxy-3-methylbut-2-enyl diphosphate reductase [Anaerohalosphaera lusitana]|uniref:4-hydroxy-3-methylbut-2-enyl diphosphate reductase n=1 Tax=Anaerohalosphaera lusitana TaxID=1936003 RepID=A0A1U9NJI8_9BACT|nr:4-hydroxy-3-methylbut-2-enyl diphosphate reductase [Anaerohalosphaera lusitana]AQT67676.1 4-hydroxy-3-methylbut-2-enyl diphosphate reductase [Anaerohalosphaera lusitana]
MKVKVAEKCGFCPGVRNAINLARKTLAENSGGKVYCLGQIIHNNDIVDELSEAGLETVDSIDEIEGGTVLIRSHGATLAEIEELEKKGVRIVDATCVRVKRVQRIARELSKERYKVVVIGDENHPEVKAVVGYAENVAVIGSREDLHKLSGHGKLGVMCQTTQSPDHFSGTVAEIMDYGFSELKIVNTLCSETKKRQDAAVKLCKEVDVMFVLGGLHSANTRKLAELCKKHNNRTFHLQNWRELDKKLVCGIETVGVTAGASTPDRVIDSFVEHVKAFGEAGE